MASAISFRSVTWTFALWLGLMPTAVHAAMSDWNCTRGKNGEQWTCKDPQPGVIAGEAGREETTPSSPRHGSPAARGSSYRSGPPNEALTTDSPRGIGLPEAPPDSAFDIPTPPPPRRVTPIAPPLTTPAPGGAAEGWTCQPGDKDEDDEQGWNCAQGVAAPTIAAAEKVEDSIEEDRAGTFTAEDDRRFQNLVSSFPVDPWKYACIDKRWAPPLTAFKLTPQERMARDTAPTDIKADYFEMFGNEVINFSGSAQLTRGDQRLSGDVVSRNTVSNTMSARGNVVYVDKGMALSSDTGFLRTQTNQGVFRNTQFIFPGIPSRGTSRLSHMDSSTLSRYENFTYTSCPLGDKDWLMHADQVKVNKDTGVGSAQHAWMEFKGVPFFYSPYLSFPVDKRRTSGLLNPSFGTSTVSGFSLQIPYYLNLAPNYDYTVTPRYLTERGFQLKNEFRYLTEVTRGRIYGDVVPYDTQAASGESSGSKNVNIPTTRGQVGVLNDTRFAQNLIGHINANYVSDPLYLNQLGSQLGLVDRVNIRSVGYLAYQGDNYSVRTQVDYYQTIDPNVIANNGQPFFHLPQVAFNYYDQILDTGLQFQGPVQIDYFQTSATNKTTGQRLSLRPRLYYPFSNSYSFLIPSVTLYHNQYWLQNPESWATANSTSTNSVVTDSTESFTVPIVSLDSGLLFDREFDWEGTSFLNTLEPRLFYDYIPYTRQDNIPVFDTTTYDYTFYQMFRENRFAGNDRVGDTNQVTAAVTSRLVDQSSGMERLRGSIGTVFYFSDRLVTLGNSNYTFFGSQALQDQALLPQATQFQSTSNLMADVGAHLNEDWSLHTGGQWNPDSNKIERGIVALQYNNRQNNVLNIAYRYRVDQYSLDCIKGVVYNGCLNLTDVSFRLPIYAGWYLMGRWQYSILDQMTLESFGGIERETCCWRFAFIVRDYINNFQTTTQTPQSNFGFFFQFEFKGLGSLSNDVDQFLSRSVSGFRYKNRY